MANFFTKKVGFCGLVTTKQYRKLFELHNQMTQAFVKMHDRDVTDLAVLQSRLEDITYEIVNYEIMTTIYQYLKGQKIDISYEDFVMCFTEQMNDVEMLEPLLQIAKELKFGVENE